jgi:hypothetical protein
MIHSDVFQRFVEDSPVSVMTQALLENTLSPTTVDSLFEQHSELQYTRELLFSDIVLLMSLVVCRIRPSINSAFKKMAPYLGVTRKSVYNKINHVETSTSAALVRHSGSALGAIIDEVGGRNDPWQPGYRVKILDGNHLPGTEHRIQPLRFTRAGALPGHSLVVLDPERMLITDVVLCEDGHAQERSMTQDILEMVQPNDLWIKDRNFCTTGFLFGIARRGGFFVTRQHGSTLRCQLVGERVAQGHCPTGAVFEQAARLSDGEGRTLDVRRITVELDEPTRDGDHSIQILTNLPESVADAIAVAELYRQRWTLETAFQELESSLHGEISTLGCPQAALFGFCLALVAYNVMSTMKASLRSVHGEKADDTKVSGYDLAEEVAGTHRGMMIAVPKDEWVVFQEMSPQEISPFLKGLASAVRLSEFRKQPRGPKKPRPKRQSGAEIKHVATSQLIEKAKTKPRPDQK